MKYLINEDLEQYLINGCEKTLSQNGIEKKRKLSKT